MEVSFFNWNISWGHRISGGTIRNDYNIGVIINNMGSEFCNKYVCKVKIIIAINQLGFNHDSNRVHSLNMFEQP